MLAAVVAVAASADAGTVDGWLVYGNTPERTGAATRAVDVHRLRALWTVTLPGRITAQALVAHSVPRGGATTIYAATSAGVLAALAPDGRERWHVRFGRAKTTCPQLDGFGITGTPAIDPATSAIYVADGSGWLHARDLGSGRERAGWPLRLYSDVKRELVWGAIAVAGGAVYVPTGSICDRPMLGKVIRVETTTRDVTTWNAVPEQLGGGGGVWGWGGVTYSRARGSIFVVTGNAFAGGTNVGRRFREFAGHAESLVELGPDLSLRSASHPREIVQRLDLDFSGSPVIGGAHGCGTLVFAANKNGRVYAWRPGAVSLGPLWSFAVPGAKRLAQTSQLAWAPRSHSVIVAAHARLTRLDIGSDCAPRIRWSRSTGGAQIVGSPTVGGSVVWYARSVRKPALVAVDLATGAIRAQAPLRHVSLVAPTVIDGRVYVGTLGGELSAFAATP